MPNLDVCINCGKVPAPGTSHMMSSRGVCEVYSGGLVVSTSTLDEELETAEESQ